LETTAKLCQNLGHEVVEAAAMWQDVRAYDEAKKAIAKGKELVPGKVTYALLNGDHPVRL